MGHVIQVDMDSSIRNATDLAYREVLRAKEKHGNKLFASIHEGYAVLLEEVSST
jgi:hypothetical protein